MQSQLKIYKASAGSGKTYTLAKSYVKILIRNPKHYKNILAITFTKKATAEMKNRILLFLQQITDNSNKQLIADVIAEIKNEYKFDVSEIIHKQAAKAIQYILHDYSHFQVTTIDSFFQLIIRSFAKELKLPIGMQIEIDTQSVLEYCVQKLLESYEYVDEDISEWLLQYVYNQIDNEKGWNIEKQITELGKELLKEEYVLLKKDIEHTHKIDFEQYQKIAKEQQEIISDYKKFVSTQGNLANEIIQKNDINVMLFSYKNSSIGSFVDKAKNGFVDSFARVQKMVDGEMALFSKDTMDKFPEEVDRVTEIWHNELHDAINSILNYHINNISKYNTANNILKNIYSMALLDELANQLSVYRNQENIILISDASYFIAKIADEEATPFIYEKMSTFIQYILIDEFQDTSALQWKSLLPIIIEILSKGYGLSLIVGDAKQSIYRWRGGKMELILHQVDIDLENYKALKQEIVLEDNYRSCPKIIEFNNSLFSCISNKYENLQLLKDAYYKHEQNIKNTIFDGYVACKWINKKEEDVFEILIQELRQINQRYNWKDVAILVRTNAEAENLATYFQQNATDIPFVSAESFLISNHLSVQLIIDTLECLIFNNNFYKYKLDNVFSIYFGIENTDKVLRKKEQFNFENYWNENNFDIININTSTLLDTVEMLLSVYKFDSSSNIYILRLLDDVHQYMQNVDNNVLGYLRYWQENKKKITILPSDDTNSIQIMTIHKAKGLEFPVVVLPFVNWNLQPKSNTIFWTENDSFFNDNSAIPLSYSSSLDDSEFRDAYQSETQLAFVDNINNLYVAFTRAEKELYIYANSIAKDDKKTKQTVAIEIKSANALLYYSLQQDEILKKYFIDESNFVFGHKLEITKSDKLSKQDVFNFSNILQNNNYTLHSSSYQDDFTLKGEILHNLLMYIHDTTMLGTQLAIIKHTYSLSDDDVDSFKKIYESVYDLFLSHKFINDKYEYFYERDFYFNNKSYRADIVIKAPESIIIIDYKTGQKEHSHEQQILVYKKAYEKLYNQNVLAYLLYTDNMQLILINQ